MGTAQSAIQALIRQAANAYTTGPAIQDAQDVCERLDKDGIRSILCYWNRDGDQPESVCSAYIDVLGIISALKLDCYLSVKAPALGFDLTLLKTILDQARSARAIVHFDALSPETADRTLALIAEARPIYSRLGCTLPGRWKRSLLDADSAIELGLRVRVVKGEWAGIGDEETDARRGFLNLVDRLAAGRARHVAVATHHQEIARVALSRLRTTGTPCELELLYGLPQRPLVEIAKEFAVPVRMYVPYGHSGLPYRLKNSAHHPRVLGWFLRDLIRANRR